MIILIAAVAKEGAIGRRGELLWHIPGDLKHFKEITMGAPVVMGRNTWESLPFRPLPGRLNIVVSRNPEYRPVNAKGEDVSDKVRMVTDPEAALSFAAEAAEVDGKDVYVIGGGNIYASSIGKADALEITEIDAQATDADTFFPGIDPAEWIKVNDVPGNQTPGDVPSYRFVRYERR